MSKISVLLIFIISCAYGYSQDTLVYPDQVIITDTVVGWEIIYNYKDRIANKHGTYIYIVNSKMKEQYLLTGTYNRNKKNSTWKTFVNDTLIFSANYKDNILHGKQKEYSNGVLVKSIKYKCDLREGKAKYYDYDSGDLTAVGRYSGKTLDIKNVESGFVYDFSNGESVKLNFSEQNKQDSILDLFDIWNPVGRIWLRKGKWKYYSKNGVLLERLIYDQSGKLLKKDIIEENEVWRIVLW